MAISNEFIKKSNEQLEYTPKMVDELKKCANDFFHFCNYVKVKHPDKGRITYTPRWYQEELLDRILNNRYIVGLLSRQVGKTITVSVYILWYAMFHSEKTIGIVSNKQSTAVKILSEIKKIYEFLPGFLKPGVKIYNMQSIEFDNNTTILASATTEDPFRSYTINILFADELGFVRGSIAEEFWASNFPTISASENSQVIVISTPNGKLNLFHRLYTGAEEGTNGFVCYKSDWTVIEGRDENWKNEQIKILGKTKFEQEHGVSFLGSSNTVIDPNILEQLLSNTKDPIQYDMSDKLRIWEKPNKDYMYCLGCLPPGEKVLTNNGYKNIEDVSGIEDKLCDINGNFHNITNKQIYKNIDEDVYKIKIYNNSRSTKFTGEHPIYASKQPKTKRWRKKSDDVHTYNKRYKDFNFEFVEAKNLEKGDWVCIPNIYKKYQLKEEDIFNKWKGYKYNLRCDFIMDNPLLDEDFWWFIGIWLGDGWLQNNNNKHTVHTCFNNLKQRDIDNAYKIKELLKKYDKCCNIYEKGKNVLYNQFCSKHLYLFLVDNFKQYSQYKEIPEWVKYLPNKFKLQLIKGYLESDGCVIRNEKRTSISITSISLNLLEGIQDILFSLGFISSISLLRKESNEWKINGKLTNTKETYYLSLDNYDSVILLEKMGINNKNDVTTRSRNIRYSHFSKNLDYIYFMIRCVEVENYKGDVYNFQTESGEFMCRNILTHNCDVAKGTGEHYSTCQVLKIISTDPFKAEQVAVFQDNYTDVYEFSNILYRLAIYYNNGYVIVENNIGDTVISELWWNHEYMGLINEGSKKTQLGIRATTKTKPKAVLTMKKLIEDRDLIIYDINTINELTSFIDKGNNTFAGKDLTDDLVSALYWACYVVNLDILEEGEFKINNEIEDDAWGILSDIEEEIEDTSWLYK